MRLPKPLRTLATEETFTRPAASMPRYYRLHSTTQTDEVVRDVLASGELWGRTPRWSDTPMVQAYVGAIDDRAGFEFTTEVSPDPDAAPGHASWSRGRPGVRAWTDIEGVQWAAIR